jgi:hypothetical protein
MGCVTAKPVDPEHIDHPNHLEFSFKGSSTATNAVSSQDSKESSHSSSTKCEDTVQTNPTVAISPTDDNLFEYSQTTAHTALSKGASLDTVRQPSAFRQSSDSTQFILDVEESEDTDDDDNDTDAGADDAMLSEIRERMKQQYTRQKLELQKIAKKDPSADIETALTLLEQQQMMMLTIEMDRVRKLRNNHSSSGTHSKQPTSSLDGDIRRALAQQRAEMDKKAKHSKQPSSISFSLAAFDIDHAKNAYVD